MTVGSFPTSRHIWKDWYIHLQRVMLSPGELGGDEDCHKLVMLAKSTEMMAFGSSSGCMACMAAMLVPLWLCCVLGSTQGVKITTRDVYNGEK